MVLQMYLLTLFNDSWTSSSLTGMSKRTVLLSTFSIKFTVGMNIKAFVTKLTTWKHSESKTIMKLICTNEYEEDLIISYVQKMC